MENQNTINFLGYIAESMKLLKTKKAWLQQKYFFLNTVKS